MEAANISTDRLNVPIMQKWSAIWQMGKPKLILTWALMALAGAICSPNYLSPAFPKTFLAQLGIFGTRPEYWSLAHSLGAAFVTICVWMGTALLNDYCDEGIDQVSNPERPYQVAVISKEEIVSWVWSFFAVAIFLTWLEGDVLALGFVIFTIVLGIIYSIPPFRLRRSGVVANAIIGVGMSVAFIGGSIAQFAVSENGLVSAVALGILAFAVSTVKDFKDMEGDKQEEIRTLPVIFGYEKAVKLNINLISAGYVIALIPMILSANLWITLGILVCFLLNWKVLRNLRQDRSLSYRRKALSLGLSCYTGVLVLYVIAQLSV